MELQPNYLIIKHDTFPLPHLSSRRSGVRPAVPDSVRQGHGRSPTATRAFRPASVINVSGMSFGSLSGPAVEALNRGSQIAGCLQSTGEGGVSSAPFEGRRSRVADRHRLLRLPRARRPLQHGPAEGSRSRARLRSVRSRSSSVKERSRVSADCSRTPRSPPRSPTSAGSDRTATASARPRTAHSGTPTKCSTSSSRSPVRPDFRSASSPPSVTRSSGRTWRG